MSGIDMSGMLVKKKNVRIDDDFRAMVLFDFAGRIYAKYAESWDTVLDKESCQEMAVEQAVDLYNKSLKALDKLD